MANGAVAHYCELLAVQVVNVLPGRPGAALAGPITPDLMWMARMAVHSTRWAPMGEEGEPPAPEDITESAEAIQGDASAILEALRQYGRRCNDVAIASTSFTVPSDLAAVIVQADVQL